MLVLRLDFHLQCNNHHRHLDPIWARAYSQMHRGITLCLHVYFYTRVWVCASVTVTQYCSRDASLLKSVDKSDQHHRSADIQSEGEVLKTLVEFVTWSENNIELVCINQSAFIKMSGEVKEHQSCLDVRRLYWLWLYTEGFMCFIYHQICRALSTSSFNSLLSCQSLNLLFWFTIKTLIVSLSATARSFFQHKSSKITCSIKRRTVLKHLMI